jgi:hypothetical protein
MASVSMYEIKKMQEQRNISTKENIKALEQEPILDKIRAEIADLDDVDHDFEGYYKAVMDALKIIDKYIAESEDK